MRCNTGPVVVAIDSNSLTRIQGNPNAARVAGAMSYANNLLWRERIVANPLVRRISLETAGIDVDPKDPLFVRNVQSGAVDAWQNSAQRTSHQYAFSGSAMSELELVFATDSSLGTAAGWSIDSLVVDCSTSSGGGTVSPPVLEEDTDTQVVLADADDTVVVKIFAPGTPVSIWTTSMSPGLDVDLYVQSGAMPNRLSQSSTHVNSADEFFHVAATNLPIYVAVHSRSGRGVATLRYARVKPASIRGSTDPIRVGFAYIPTPSRMAAAKEVFRLAQGAFWGMTEGRIQIRSVELYDDGPDLLGNCLCGSSYCNVCIRDSTDRAFCNMTTRVVWLYEQTFLPAGRISAARMISHEWGHCVLGLWDEYQDHGHVESCKHGDDQCLHTAMANHNLMYNLCGDFAHARESGGSSRFLGHVCSACNSPIPGSPGWLTCSDTCASCALATPSQWSQLQQAGLVYSYPNQAQNLNQYFGNQALPFSVIAK